MNADSQQITLDKSLVIDRDQPLKPKQLIETVLNTLGHDKAHKISIPPRKMAVEYNTNGKRYHLIVKACTYLGNPHPIYKKRIQLPEWFNEYVNTQRSLNPAVEVRFIGVYHYGTDFYGDNIIFIDYKTDTYLSKKGNNSSAHVYINDLYQCMTYGVFSKTDAYGNHITTIRRDKLITYLSGEDNEGESLFDLFRKFNHGFPFGTRLRSIDVIKEMHKNKWSQWRQAEWPGWYLEYRFNKFTVENDITDKIRYIGSSHKREGELDFDIRFEDEDFYGDLKASDIRKKETPANDQKSVVECIRHYEKFWYVIYEHETVKDKDSGTDFEATRARNRYIRMVDPDYDKNELSYSSRMKHSVKFVKMTIIELNRINFRDALKDFNQGQQPDGSPRNPKFNIKKDVLSDDNFVVFRYTYSNDEEI